VKTQTSEFNKELNTLFSVEKERNDWLQKVQAGRLEEKFIFVPYFIPKKLNFIYYNCQQLIKMLKTTILNCFSSD